MKDRNLLGDRLYSKIEKSCDVDIFKMIPSKEEWQRISGKGNRSKAEWWKENVPLERDRSYSAFNRLAKAYDIYTRGFYYWRRRLKAIRESSD